MPPAGPGIQSSKPAKVDASLVNIKGHDYYKDNFVPPEETVTEIDARDKVGAPALGALSLSYPLPLAHTALIENILAARILPNTAAAVCSL